MDWTERHLLDAYVFGYPLVYNVSSMQAIAAHGLGTLPPARFNTFAHATGLASPADAFVSVNNDTVYALGLLDLSGGPLLLHVPDTDGAYYVLQFVDAWTNNFAYVGRRATGTAEGTYLITPPGWTGSAPDGVPVIESPTDLAAIVGRLAVDGDDDMPRVRALQPQFTLTPLEDNAAAPRHPAAARRHARAPAVLGAAARLEPGVPAGPRRRGLPAPVRGLRPHRPAQSVRHRRPRPRGAPRERLRRGPERRGGDVEARPVGRP